MAHAYSASAFALPRNRHGGCGRFFFGARLIFAIYK
jgi:hypothetical protein